MHLLQDDDARRDDSSRIPEEKAYEDAIRNMSVEQINAIEADPTVRPTDSDPVKNAKTKYAAYQGIGFGAIDMRRSSRPAA